MSVACLYTTGVIRETNIIPSAVLNRTRQSSPRTSDTRPLLAPYRKFLVCDFPRFEEHYPYVARADRDIVQQLVGKPRTSPGDPHGQAAVVDDPPRADNAACSLATGGKGNENHLNSRGSSAVAGSPKRPSSPLQHVYEIIRERSPCRMYFDLEFTRGSNEGLDGEALVQAWINVVAGEESVRNERGLVNDRELLYMV